MTATPPSLIRQQSSRWSGSTIIARRLVVLDRDRLAHHRVRVERRVPAAVDGDPAQLLGGRAVEGHVAPGAERAVGGVAEHAPHAPRAAVLAARGGAELRAAGLRRVAEHARHDARHAGVDRERRLLDEHAGGRAARVERARRARVDPQVLAEREVVLRDPRATSCRASSAARRPRPCGSRRRRAPRRTPGRERHRRLAGRFACGSRRRPRSRPAAPAPCASCSPTGQNPRRTSLADASPPAASSGLRRAHRLRSWTARRQGSSDAALRLCFAASTANGAFAAVRAAIPSRSWSSPAGTHLADQPDAQRRRPRPAGSPVSTELRRDGGRDEPRQPLDAAAPRQAADPELRQRARRVRRRSGCPARGRARSRRRRPYPFMRGDDRRPERVQARVTAGASASGRPSRLRGALARSSPLAERRRRR